MLEGLRRNTSIEGPRTLFSSRRIHLAETVDPGFGRELLLGPQARGATEALGRGTIRKKRAHGLGERAGVEAQVDGAVAFVGGGTFFSNRIDDAFAVVDAGSPDVDVSGVEAGGENVPILRGGHWQL